MKKLTVDQVMALGTCPDYPRERVEELIPPEGLQLSKALPVLLSLPVGDARWVLSELMSAHNCGVWAQASADRAREYAARAYADADAHTAIRAAVYHYYPLPTPPTRTAAARAAAADAAAAAASWLVDTSTTAARAAEHQKACEHGIELLKGQE